MIGTIRNKALKRLYANGDRRGLNPQYAERIEIILGVLDVADSIDDIRLPGFRLHALSGNLKGFWAVTVSANWRVIFRYEGNTALDVDLIDYH